MTQWFMYDEYGYTERRDAVRDFIQDAPGPEREPSREPWYVRLWRRLRR